MPRPSRDLPRPASPSGAKVIRPPAFRREAAVSPDDRTLVEEALAGDVMAREALFDRYAEEVERLAYRLLGNDPDIADLIQDVFLEVFRNLRRLRDPSAMRAWLRAVTTATARKRIRSRRRRRWLRFLPQEELPEMEAVEVDDEALAALKATYALLDELSVELRVVFALRHLEGLELTEVADACRVSLATVKRRLKKAEDRFVARARRDPLLVDWIEAGNRWEATP